MALWHKLKSLEIDITNLLASGMIPDDDSMVALQALFSECSCASDAEEAICYHGARSLLAQLGGDYDKAIAYPEIEGRMIERLYELEEENPTDGWSLRNFREGDLRKRAQILERLKTARADQGEDTNPTPLGS